MRLTERERIVAKLAAAHAIKALLEILQTSEASMHNYRIKCEGQPEKDGYYDTHRQFKEMEYVTEDKLDHMTHYDDDLSDGMTSL